MQIIDLKYLLRLVIISGMISFSCAVFATDPTELPVPTPSPLIAVITRIQALNYPIVKSIELTQGIYKVEAINRLGKIINLDVDPTTLNVITPKGANTMQLSILDAINQVTNSGYHNIYKITPTDKGYEMQALDKDGNQVDLNVDATNGMVSKDWF